MSNSIDEMKDLELFIVTGSNTSETHPVVSTFLHEAVVRKGVGLMVVDPRGIEMADFAALWLRQKPGTDVAAFSAMANAIVTEGLYDEQFITARDEGVRSQSGSLPRGTEAAVPRVRR
jgi:predicted molibdopterin-dependent oxidoreductase YjgC